MGEKIISVDREALRAKLREAPGKMAATFRKFAKKTKDTAKRKFDERTAQRSQEN